MNSEIPLNKWGKILEGKKYPGWFILVEYDTKDTGGYYIYYAKDKDDISSEGYDDWVENLEQVKEYLNHFKLRIEWD